MDLQGIYYRLYQLQFRDEVVTVDAEQHGAGR